MLYIFVIYSVSAYQIVPLKVLLSVIHIQRNNLVVNPILRFKAVIPNYSQFRCTCSMIVLKGYNICTAASYLATIYLEAFQSPVLNIIKICVSYISYCIRYFLNIYFKLKYMKLCHISKHFEQSSRLRKALKTTKYLCTRFYKRLNSKAYITIDFGTHMCVLRLRRDSISQIVFK